MKTYRGIFGSSLIGLQRILADSPTLRRAVAADTGGEATAEAAIDRIYFEDLYPPEGETAIVNESRPLALIGLADGVALEQYAGGAKNWLSRHWQLRMILSDRERLKDDRPDHRDSLMAFLAFVDGVIVDLSKRAGGDHIPITGITVLERPVRVSLEREPSAGAYWDVGFLIDGGIEG